ncbi:MAG: bifunctional hydroxymethylpyrimidine kinase/phosphomethylpyrimidine kinase, partial [Methylophilus sp.]
DVVNSLYGMQLSNELGLIKDYHWERLAGSYHGSGCTLASAIAACLAHGLVMEEAIQEAQEYTWQTLKNAFRPGMGQFIPDRFFWAREESQEDDKAVSIQH